MKNLKTQSALIAPSILSANFINLGQEIQEVENAGADWLHIDVMDGQFVPNLTLGPLIVEAIRPWTRMKIDCHLMVKEPEKWLEPFAKAGADLITVHVEATSHLNRVLHRIRDLGCQVGVSLNPASPLVLIEEVLDLVDLVLVMSVNPGFGGQTFIESSLLKVERLVQERGTRPFLIEIDGGVNLDNIRRISNAGGDVFVAGSAIFSQKDRFRAIAELRTQAQRFPLK